MQEEMYAPDKPSECSKCYFWKGTRSGCSLGKGNCYYLIREAPKVPSECDGCPYGRDHPCIGWCTKKILKECEVLQQIQEQLGILPMSDPYDYVKRLQSEFDDSRIEFSDEYYDVLGIER